MGETHGSTERYPRAAKRTIGKTKAVFSFFIPWNMKAEEIIMARYASAFLPGNQVPDAMPAIREIRRGITGRE